MPSQMNADVLPSRGPAFSALLQRMLVPPPDNSFGLIGPTGTLVSCLNIYPTTSKHLEKCSYKIFIFLIIYEHKSDHPKVTVLIN